MSRSARVHVLFAIAVGFVCAPPTALAAPSCGDVVTGRITLDAGLDCPGDGLRVESDDVVLDCSGHRIRGAGSPDRVGIRVFGASRSTIRGCTISGFATGVLAERSEDLVLERSSIADNGIRGLAIRDGARPRIVGNRFERQRFQVSVIGSPDPFLADNAFVAHERGGSVSFNRAANPVLLGNRFLGGAGVSVFRAGDSGCRIESNDFGIGPSEIEVFDTDGCRIVRNRLEAAPSGPSGFGIRLDGTRGSDVLDNRIVGPAAFGILILAGSDSESHGAEENRVAGNGIEGVGIGIYVIGGSRNVVEGNRIEGTELALGVYEGSSGPSRENRFERNEMLGNVYGIVVADGVGNHFERNTIRESEIGVLELRTRPGSSVPDRFESNLIQDNRLFGFVAWGASPALTSNAFVRNGLHAGPPDPRVTPLPEFLDASRAAVVSVPFAGTAETLDDGIETNDAVPSIDLGVRTGGNRFVRNASPAIRFLDAGGGIAPSPPGASVRQEWFGAIRVLDADGNPVPGATVDVWDAQGRPQGSWTSDENGLVPPGADLSRSQGLLSEEPGGPRPAWIRFAEFEIGPRSRRASLTPHRVVATEGTRSGCKLFSFDGAPRPGETAPDGRYQVATVRLGSRCGVRPAFD